MPPLRAHLASPEAAEAGALREVQGPLLRPAVHPEAEEENFGISVMTALEHRGKLQARAGKLVGLAIQGGTLRDLKRRRTRCADCNETATVYDHRDYREPLKVQAVCDSCNSRRGPADPCRDLLLTKMKLCPWPQQQIVKLVAAGLTVKEIAKRLGMSPNTVRTHRSAITARTGICDRVKLTLWAQRVGLVKKVS